MSNINMLFMKTIFHFSLQTLKINTVESRISGIFGHSEIFHYCEIFHYFGCSFYSINNKLVI